MYGLYVDALLLLIYTICQLHQSCNMKGIVFELCSNYLKLQSLHLTHIYVWKKNQMVIETCMLQLYCKNSYKLSLANIKSVDRWRLHGLCKWIKRRIGVTWGRQQRQSMSCLDSVACCWRRVCCDDSSFIFPSSMASYVSSFDFFFLYGSLCGLCLGRPLSVMVN